MLQDKNRHKQSGVAKIPSVQWQDVGGLEHVRREIMKAIEYPFHYPHLFANNGSAGRGVLLYGPPGTGKTLVAKAVATECGVPFLSVKGPELLGSYAGESEVQVRGVFEQARQLAAKNQPSASILFFDELDSLAPRRGDHASGGNVMDRVMATLFAELDKHPKDGCTVFCIRATNRPIFWIPLSSDPVDSIGLCIWECHSRIKGRFWLHRYGGCAWMVATPMTWLMPLSLIYRPT
jgi:peroxin-6